MPISERQFDTILQANGFEVSLTVPDNNRAIYRFEKDGKGHKISESRVCLGTVPRLLYNHILDSAPHAAFAAKELLSHFNVTLDVSLPSVGGELQVKLSPEYKAELVEKGVDVEALDTANAAVHSPRRSAGGAGFRPGPRVAAAPVQAQAVFDEEEFKPKGRPEGVDLGMGNVPDEDLGIDPMILGIDEAPSAPPDESVTFKDKKGNTVTGKVTSVGSMPIGDVPARKHKAEEFFKKHGVQ